MIQRVVNYLAICFILCGYLPKAIDCSTNSIDLSYFEYNFDDLYKKDYSNFWKILYNLLMDAERCNSIEATSKFLNLANITSINAEFNEFFAENIEKLCLNSPMCFHKANKTLNESVQIKLNMMLNNPIFIDRSSLYKSGCLNPAIYK